MVAGSPCLEQPKILDLVNRRLVIAGHTVRRNVSASHHNALYAGTERGGRAAEEWQGPRY